MQIIRRLKDLLLNSGLTESEVDFYVCILKNPRSTVNEISKKTKIPKDRCYLISESLHEKNLLNISGNRNKKMEVKPLTGYINRLESRARKSYRIADSLKEVGNILPILNIDENASFQAFGHEECGEKFLDLSYLKWDLVYGLGDLEKTIGEAAIDADRQFIIRRMKKGGKCFAILTNPGKYTKELIGKDMIENRRTKIFNSEKLKNFFFTIIPEANSVGIFKNDMNSIHGIIIQSKLLTDSYFAMYDEVNKTAEPINYRNSVI